MSHQGQIDKFGRFGKIGCRFKYLGIDMMTEYIETKGMHLVALVAVYKNNNGELVREDFYGRQVPALELENPE